MSQLPARDAKALVRRAPRSHANVGVTKGPSTTAIDHAHAVAILAAALDAVITIDHEGIVLEFNPAAEATFGYRREAAVGRELAELIVPPQFRAAHRLGMSRWTAAGPTTGAGGLLGSRIEIVAMRADGTEFPVELAITCMPGDAGPLFIAYLRDISQRVRAEQLRGLRLAITQQLAQLLGTRETIAALLRAVCEQLHWEFGAFWAADRAAAALVCVDVWSAGGVRDGSRLHCGDGW